MWLRKKKKEAATISSDDTKENKKWKRMEKYEFINFRMYYGK